jgi:hypothetical protein
MTHWFDRKPGSIVSQSCDDPAMLLVGDEPPDWVRQPPELGARELRVLEAFAAPCPKCRDEQPVRHLLLEDRYGVAECPSCNFVWYRYPEQDQ